VSKENGHVWLSYERNDSAHALKGRQELRYFLGSGKRGRTYLFEQQGYWFEAPINWYAKKQIWDMPPNFQSTRQMQLTLPVDPGCLHCHASGVAQSLPDARNHYAGEPFASGGITCAACHGDASAHLASRGKVHMLDIDKLEPVRRDSVCLACHLEGQSSVIRKGSQAGAFRVGENLFEHELFFVYKAGSGSEGRAVSQWEALLKSTCKQKSGDRLTCTTCHDPHGPPAPEERVAFYRQRCLQCHNQGGFAANHHPEQPACTECHMARPPSNDIAHEQVTDHWIRRRVSQERLPLPTSGELVPVGGMTVEDRDLGLAYAQMAARGDRAAGSRAMELLESAEKKAGGAADDHDLHTELGFLEQLNGQTKEAAEEYRLALGSDVYDSTAGGDLALIEAQHGNVPEAIRLWRAVFEHDPAEVEAGNNLAIVECAEGDRAGAEAALSRLLTFAPDNERARALDRGIRSGTQSCGGK
jgi:predicted CXXCH cytochrome family protein